MVETGNIVDHIEIIVIFISLAIFFWKLNDKIEKVEEALKEFRAVAQKEHEALLKSINESHAANMKATNEEHREMIKLLAGVAESLSVVNSSLDKHIIADMHKNPAR